jgi:acyl-CoA reductase-like NAD-dependent aldehyde dehydrogenase
MSNTLDQKHSIPEISEDAVDQLKLAQRRAQHQRWARMSPEERANLIKSQLPATTSEPEEPFVGMEM